MTFKEYIATLKRWYIGVRVLYEGKEYTVVDVDANAALLIDKPDQFKETTAVETSMVKVV